MHMCSVQGLWLILVHIPWYTLKEQWQWLQVGETSTPIKELLSENLKQADNLRMGQLANGFSYVMLPNKVPPQRFEAHLEMHAGMIQTSALQLKYIDRPSHQC